MANKLYTNPETSITWTDATTGGDELLDLGGLAGDAVAMGSFLDRGASARATRFRYTLIVDGYATAPAVNDSVDLYFSQSNDSTTFDGRPTTAPTTTAQGTITLAQAKNCLPVDSAIAYSTTAGDVLQVSGIVTLTGRYIAPVVHNNNAGSDALKSSSDAHKVILTPIPDELQ